MRVSITEIKEPDSRKNNCQNAEKRLLGKGAVLIEGAKWCGKTTTAEQIAPNLHFKEKGYRHSKKYTQPIYWNSFIFLTGRFLQVLILSFIFNSGILIKTSATLVLLYLILRKALPPVSALYRSLPYYGK